MKYRVTYIVSVQLVLHANNKSDSHLTNIILDGNENKYWMFLFAKKAVT